MTTDEFIAKQQEKIDAIIKNDVPLFRAVRSVMALQSDRIFRKGLNKSGSDIGDYGNEEVYINPKNSPKSFPLYGKRGTKKVDAYSIKTRKKVKVAVTSGNTERQTGYFANWLEYKKTIGKNKLINTVDLNWTGELSRSWANGKVSNPQATKINVHQYNVQISDFNADKVRRYGLNEVFGVSKYEKEMFVKTITEELARALK